MNQPDEYTRVCPTRIDGAPTLFAHRVSPDQCQDRQRGLYHKCFTCAHNNAYAAARRAAPLSRPADELSPEPAARSAAEAERVAEPPRVAAG